MEKRIGVIAILVTERRACKGINDTLHAYGHLVLGRQGLPLRDKGVNVISLIVEGDTDELGALSGKLGRFPGVKVKSVLHALSGAGETGRRTRETSGKAAGAAGRREPER